ncbi:MAG: transcription termination factor NusA [Desulfosoma sp.]|uniref:transcription termination factor NusA n=1 Tax=Desulfosoma sp. TaxID=2603217 RepID=UPI00404B4699
MASELKRLIDQVSREKGIDRAVLIDTLVEAVKSAIKKRYGSKIDVEVSYNDEFGEMEAFTFKEVVEEVEDPEKQISLEQARDLDPESEIGDELGIRMDTDTLGRIAAQSAKQVIIQKMKDAEREATYEEYKDRKREIITGIVQKVDRSGIIVNLGRAEAILPVKEQIPREVYRQGDRIRAYILDVKKISKGPQIVLSRTHPDFLIQLFRIEVPEVSDGTVSILAAAREPGSRAKIAVVSKDPDVDPVGACVGMKGSRVQAVVQELRGEKIDIVPWNMDPAKFVVNALAPAIITKVIIDQTNRSMEVIVPDDQLSLAIGRRGQNVRLASRITGWHIDVKSESRYERQKQAGYQALLHIDNLSEEMADKLYEAGITSLRDFCEADTEELESLTGLSMSALEAMQAQAQTLLETSQELEADETNEDEAENHAEDEGKVGEPEPEEQAKSVE